MRVLICAIGRIGRDEEASLEDGYLKQAKNLSRTSGLWTDIKVLEEVESRADTVVLRQADEAKRLQIMTKDSICIALDPRGKDLTSEDLVALIQRQREQGAKSLAFIIGGPDGIAAELRESCTMSLRFGAQTWPHRLVRVMLAEQLFRSATLAAGVPYSR